MARHCKTDKPHRGVLVYKWTAYDHSDDEICTETFGPYDSLSITKTRTRQESRQYLYNLDNKYPGTHWRGYTEIIEIRFEQVKEWETVGVEFTIP